MASLNLRGVGKSFGKTVAVADVSLDIADGEFIALVGPSGCGKTTLLRLIAGLENGQGDICIGDRCVTTVDPRDRNVAMVFQTYALYPHMTALQNLMFPLRMHGVLGADARARAIAETLGLSDLLHRKPKQLSGGQRQRVALGRAIVRDPAVFLMDEPLSNLDANLRAQMRSELKQIHRRLGATFVYVTHDLSEALAMADRLVVMDRGRVQQVGVPGNVVGAPANDFVRAFVSGVR